MQISEIAEVLHIPEGTVKTRLRKARNQLAHDYDGSYAMEKFNDIVNIYYPLFEELKNKTSEYYA